MKKKNFFCLSLGVYNPNFDGNGEIRGAHDQLPNSGRNPDFAAYNVGTVRVILLLHGPR